MCEVSVFENVVVVYLEIGLFGEGCEVVEV